jgi:hypothetical protein
MLSVEQKIGEQKIDVVFAEDQARPIEHKQSAKVYCYDAFKVGKAF